MDTPDPPVSAGRTLRSLRLDRQPYRVFALRGVRHNDSAPQSPWSWCQPPSPKLSLRRILEQRNFLPVSRPHTTHRAVHASWTDVGQLWTQPPVLGLHLAAHVPREPSIIIHTAMPMEERGQDRPIYHDDTEFEQLIPHDRYEELHLPPGQQHVPSSLSQPTREHRPVPPASSSRVSSSSLGSSSSTGHSRRRTMSAAERREARTCKIEGCSNYIVDNQRCFRHGGGKRCSIDGCISSAKQLGLCWRHGGSILCKVEGCPRGVKVRGLCWGHGGGKKKKQMPPADAATTQVSSASSYSDNRRCIFDGCRSAPVLHSFCDAHCREVVRPGYIFEL